MFCALWGRAASMCMRYVSATSAFNVRSMRRLMTRVTSPISFPSGSSGEYTDSRACTRIPICEKVFIINCRRSILAYTFLPCIAYFGSELDVFDSHRTTPFVEGKQPPSQHDPGFPPHARTTQGSVRHCRCTEHDTNIHYSTPRVGSGMRYVRLTCSFVRGND